MAVKIRPRRGAWRTERGAAPTALQPSAAASRARGAMELSNFEPLRASANGAAKTRRRPTLEGVSRHSRSNAGCGAAKSRLPRVWVETPAQVHSAT